MALLSCRPDRTPEEPTPLRTGSPHEMNQWLSGIACLELLGLPVLAGCAPWNDQSGERFVATGELVALSGGGAGADNACFTCHGLQGEGDGAASPRLASLPSGYLERQLEAFADGRRNHPKMSWISRHLAPETRRLVSGYYEGLPYSRPGPIPAGASRLYHQGAPERGVPACASCHGSYGEGLGPANPPLAGQPASYLMTQLDQWRRSERRNDPGEVMLRISRLLSPSESAAVSAYAATLGRSPPSPESRAASPEVHRAGSRSDVSGPPLHEPESARAGG